MWFRTVSSARPSVVAICVVEAPSASRASTSRCRGVRREPESARLSARSRTASPHGRATPKMPTTARSGWTGTELTHHVSRLPLRAITLISKSGRPAPPTTFLASCSRERCAWSGAASDESSRPRASPKVESASSLSHRMRPSRSARYDGTPTRSSPSRTSMLKDPGSGGRLTARKAFHTEASLCTLRSRDELPAPRGPPRAGRDVVARRPVLHGDPRRARRGRRQGRAAGLGRRDAAVVAGVARRGRHVPLREREQALARPRPHTPGRARGAPAPGRPRRRLRPVAPRRDGRAARPRPRGAARAQRAARLLLDRLLREPRAAARAAGLRPAHAGVRRNRQRDRRARPAGRADGRLARRPGRRPVGRARDPRGAPGARRDRTRPARRGLPVRDRGRAPAVPPHELPRDRRGPGPARHRVPGNRPVPDLRRGRGRADGRGAERPAVRGAVRRPRPPRAAGRRALRDEPGACRAPRGARRAARGALRRRAAGGGGRAARRGGRARPPPPRRRRGRPARGDGPPPAPPRAPAAHTPPAPPPPPGGGRAPPRPGAGARRAYGRGAGGGRLRRGGGGGAVGGRRGPARERARAVDLARQLAPEQALQPLGDADELVEVDPRLDAVAPEEVDEILGRDVAGGAGAGP